MRHEGDASLPFVSPDGRLALIGLADESDGHWRMNLSLLELATGKTSTLYRPYATTYHGWLPDQSAIAFTTRSDPDTLVLMRPDGTELSRRSFPAGTPQSMMEVCGPGFVLELVLPPGQPARFLRVPFDPGASPRAVEPAAALLGNFRCSPDGRMVAYQALVDGVGRPVLEDLVTGDTLLGPPEIEGVVAWLPSPSPKVAQAVEVQPDTLPLEWGRSATLSATVAFSDGSIRSDTLVTWSSSDPSIAYVTPDGELFASGGGSATVQATVHGWISDSVTVVVDAVSMPRQALFADRFEAPMDGRWRAFGAPLPELTHLEDGPALELTGDGVGSDGILSLAAYDLSRGATLEVDYRLPLTRRDRQSFSACLFARAEEGVDPDPGQSRSQGRSQQVCYVHPVGELAAFDPAAFSFQGQIPVGRQSRPDLLSDSDWIRLVIVVAPDGNARLLINGIEVSRLPVPLDLEPPARWEIELTGRAADTHLLVRDLVLWEGMRY